jgi:hypothetical protein
MRDEELSARLRTYADQGGQPRRPAPSQAQLRRRGCRALLRNAAGTVLVVVLVVGGGAMWAGRAGVQLPGGVVNQPRPSPAITPPVTSPPSSTTPSTSTSPAPTSTLPGPPPDTPGRLSLGSRVTATGIGPVQVGMSVPQAEGAGGVRLQRTMDEYYPRCWYVVPKGWPKVHDHDLLVDRVGFMITGGTIARIDVWAGSIATREGIRIGSTERQVQRAYPGRITVTHDRFGVRQLRFTPPGHAGYRILFQSDGRQVTRFRAGKVTQVVNYDEGCA